EGGGACGRACVGAAATSALRWLGAMGATSSRCAGGSDCQSRSCVVRSSFFICAWLPSCSPSPLATGALVGARGGGATSDSRALRDASSTIGAKRSVTDTATTAAAVSATGPAHLQDDRRGPGLNGIAPSGAGPG